MGRFDVQGNDRKHQKDIHENDSKSYLSRNTSSLRNLLMVMGKPSLSPSTLHSFHSNRLAH